MTQFLILDDRVGTHLVPCWVKLVGLINVKEIGIFDEATEYGTKFGTELNSNLPNWIKSARGRSRPIVSTNSL